MSQNSSIEWTDTTWSPVTGCTRASAGCDNCYAVRMTHRLDLMGKDKYRGLTVLNPAGTRHFNGRIRLHERELATPLGWKKPQKVFVCSMSDLFHRDVPFEFIDRVWDVMRRTPQHTYQILTKRPERMAAYFEDVIRTARQAHGSDLRYIPLPNVWIGTSVENQAAADERIPHLLKCPAAVRFLSAEPMLGHVSIEEFCMGYSDNDVNGGNYYRLAPDARGLHWVIVGGESGPGARPFNLEWARSIIDQCKAAGVACFVKQMGSRPVYPIPGMEETRRVNQPFMGSGWGYPKYRDPKGGEMSEWPDDLRARELPEVARD